jgi:hypothetical protein
MTIPRPHERVIEGLRAIRDGDISVEEAYAKIAGDLVEGEQAQVAAVMRGILEGANGRELKPYEVDGIDFLISGYLFGDRVPGSLSDEDHEQARVFSKFVASDRLLTKAIGAWYLEGQVVDWKDNVDGIVGSALDRATEVLATYQR